MLLYTSMMAIVTHTCHGEMIQSRGSCYTAMVGRWFTCGIDCQCQRNSLPSSKAVAVWVLVGRNSLWRNPVTSIHPCYSLDISNKNSFPVISQSRQLEIHVDPKYFHPHSVRYSVIAGGHRSCWHPGPQIIYRHAFFRTGTVWSV